MAQLFVGNAGRIARPYLDVPEQWGDRRCSLAWSSPTSFAADANRVAALCAGFVEGAPAEHAAEYILDAYMRGGVPALTALLGEYAVAVWDARRERLVVLADPSGSWQIYYTHLPGNGIAFALLLRTLLSAHSMQVRISRPGLASLLSQGAASAPHTIAANAYTLAPDAVLTWSGVGVVSVDRFPRARVPTARTPATFRDALARSLAERLRTSPAVLLLSGGIDSAALFALSNAPVDTVHLELPGGAAGAKAAKSIATGRGATLHCVTRSASDERAAFKEHYREQDQPALGGIYEHLVVQAVREVGATAAVIGVGADELFDGRDLVRQCALLEALRWIPTRSGRFVTRRAWPELDTRSWLAGGIQRGASYALLRRVFGPDQVATLLGGDRTYTQPLLARNRKLANSVLQASLDGMRARTLRHVRSAAIKAGIDLRMPYLEPQVVEAALALPAQLRVGPRKALLREIAGDVTTGNNGSLSAIYRGPGLSIARETLVKPGSWLRGAGITLSGRDLARLVEDASVEQIWTLYAIRRWWEEVVGAP